jgi:exodeoxyribonuclease-3
VGVARGGGQGCVHKIIEDARDWEKCSDHVPLITEFDL